MIAKLDRLARNVHFLSGLMDGGVEFVCLRPAARPNRLTIHILAAVAEDEAKRISRADQGGAGGLQGPGRVARVPPAECPPANRRGQPDGRAAGRGGREGATPTRRTPTWPTTSGPGGRRALSFAAIARKLNELGHTTRRGKPWNPVQVKRVLDRLKPPA